jgi:hypothetical protein
MNLDWAVRLQEELASLLILRWEGRSVGLLSLPSARGKAEFLYDI